MKILSPRFKRYFRIWQKTGEMPFRKREEKLEPVICSSCGRTVDTPFCPYCGQAHSTKSKSFFSGSFSSIPFLNDDAKRTLVHLLLRPGYMIKDYLSGLNSRYLAPMTALIIFYAFFALVTAIVAPESEGDSALKLGWDDAKEMVVEPSEDGQLDSSTVKAVDFAKETVVTFKTIHEYLNLDLNPDLVDSPAKASLAAFEGALRSQGVFVFIGQLLMLTLALWMVFARRKRLSFSASATLAAYILCQFCFFRLITLLITWGRSTSLGLLILAVLLTLDYHQLFGFDWRKSLRFTIKTGVAWCLIIGLSSTLIVGSILAFQYLVL